MTIRRTLAGLATFSLGLVLLPALAMAQGEGFGGGDRHTTTEPIEFRASSTFVADFESVTVPARDHVTHNAAPPCARTGVVSTDGMGNENYGCVLFYRCGGERIDDAFSGELSGQTPGVYADFLVNYAPDVLGPVDVADLNETFLEATLGEAPDDLVLPVFYYCRRGPGGIIETLDPAYSPSFGWDTTVEAEYDTDAVANGIYDEVVALLNAAPPEIHMTPPLEQRRTIVRFPSWFWIGQPASLLEVYAESDLDTILIEGRAILSHVEWQLGDFNLDCTLDQMLAFNADDHHAGDDRPHCSHVFETLDDWDLAATLHYDVEQRTTRRLASGSTYNVGAWEPHPTAPTHSVTTTIGTMETHEFRSVNVPITEGG